MFWLVGVLPFLHEGRGPLSVGRFVAAFLAVALYNAAQFLPPPSWCKKAALGPPLLSPQAALTTAKALRLVFRVFLVPLGTGPVALV